MNKTRRRPAVVATGVALVALFLAIPQVAHAARPKCLGMRATIVGTAGADVLRGTAGDDVIAGLGGNDVLKGLGGDDDICGGPGNDRLVGGPGSFDRLSGGPGNDTLLGGAGSDFLLGGSGNDVLNGGDSYDDASFEHSPNAVTADLTAGTATGEGSDTLIGVDNLTGSPHDDVLVGDANGNALIGLDGDDILSAGAERDLLVGGSGDDSLDGGTESDAASFWSATGSVTVDLTAGTATGEGSDTLANIEELSGSWYDDTLIGDAGPNVFYPGGGDDTVDGEAGEDMVVFWNAQGPVTVDLSAGTASGEGADTLADVEDVFGSYYDDHLTGDAGPNLLAGLNGDDTIAGGDGDDELYGDAGTDTLDGGAGTDTCDGESEVNCET